MGRGSVRSIAYSTSRLKKISKKAYFLVISSSLVSSIVYRIGYLDIF